MIKEEILKKIDLARRNAIMILIGDGHPVNGFYVNDTNLFHDMLIQTLSHIKDEITVKTLNNLSAKNYEAIYLLMKNYKITDKETLKEFNLQYCHYLNALDNLIKNEMEIVLPNKFVCVIGNELNRQDYLYFLKEEFKDYFQTIFLTVDEYEKIYRNIINAKELTKVPSILYIKNKEVLETTFGNDKNYEEIQQKHIKFINH